jgi:serine/threonine protein kinase/Tfp pilus assembly protein PilF
MPSSSDDSSDRLKPQVRVFLDAYCRQLSHGPVALRDFLPKRKDALYLPVLRALVLFDLERSWQAGRPRSLEDYGREFPELLEAQSALQDLALCEFRLRQQAGQSPSPTEYAERFGVDTSGWKSANGLRQSAQTVEPPATTVQRQATGDAVSFSEQVSGILDQSGSADSVQEVAQGYQDFLGSTPQPDPAALEEWAATFKGLSTVAQLFCQLHKVDPGASQKIARTISALPKIGEEFAGFRLAGQLGHGVFGRVYLAQQSDLANRYVALKVSSELASEPERLALLQHTNIVPIYSVHRQGVLQAVCMPYLGTTTLAHLLNDLRQDDTIPASGQRLLSTLGERRSALELALSTVARGPSTTVSRAPDGPAVDAGLKKLPHAGDPALAAHRFERLSYVDCIVWLGSRMAAGLAHAHERGILHRDLKPANVLLTDDGQPMLLDFHLAEQVAESPSPGAALIGGTLEYMAPEHLDAFWGADRVVDERSDVYSLGVILYELLTAHRLFKVQHGTERLDLGALLQERLRPPPEVRDLNRAVSPAVESIVRHCMEPDPQARYQSAAELREDLERQQQDLPLKYATERSVRERAAKWRRRNPRLARTIGLVALVSILLLTASTYVWQSRRAAQAEVWKAQSVFEQFRADSIPTRYKLSARLHDAADRKAGVKKGEELLARYSVLDSPSWVESSPAVHLPPDQLSLLQSDVGEILFLLARAAMVEGASARGSDRNEALERARRLSEKAAANFKSPRPEHIQAQQAELKTLLAPATGPAVLQSRTTNNSQTPRDRFLLGLDYLDQQRFAPARDLLMAAVREDPKNVAAWAALGVCHDRLGEFGQSVACYTAAIALWPDHQWLYYDRGIAYRNQSDFDRARSDFNEAIRCQPDWPDPYAERALTWQAQKKYPEAIADLTHALNLGVAPCWGYLLRARVRELSGDKKGARHDREAGMRYEPKDDAEWRARGDARLESDPAGARADFEKALKLNPLSLRGLNTRAYLMGQLENGWIDAGLKCVERDPTAALAYYERALELNPTSWLGLMNKVHALENLGRLDEAVVFLDKAAAVPHGNEESRSTRGVLLARLGKRESAHADAKASMADRRPISIYRAACVYALTSRKESKDRAEALRLLAEALRRGFGVDYIEDDPDLDPLRQEPAFKRILEAVRELKNVPRPTLPKEKQDTAASASGNLSTVTDRNSRKSGCMDRSV